MLFALLLPLSFFSLVLFLLDYHGNPHKPVTHPHQKDTIIFELALSAVCPNCRSFYPLLDCCPDADPIEVQPYFTLLELNLRPGFIPHRPSSCGDFLFSLCLLPVLFLLTSDFFFHSFLSFFFFRYHFYAIIKTN